MEIDWRRKAACHVVSELPEDFDDAMKILEFAAFFLARMMAAQTAGRKGQERLPEVQDATVVPFRILSKI